MILKQQIPKWRYRAIIFLLILFTLFLVIGFLSEIIYSWQNSKELYRFVGCWKKVAEDNRSIIIKVDNENLEEIMDTLRHEVCHEIYYRMNGTMFPRDKNEQFAETCNPEDYYYLDKK